MNTNQTDDDSMPDTLIFVLQETLSDGSKTYNVSIGELLWHATSLEDAQQLAEEIMDAINTHTVDLADVIDETE